MQTARILIVEDEALVAMAAADVLEAYGYSIVGTAVSHEEAMACCADAALDLALVDIRLKGLTDGIETARRLRAEKGCRVLFVTGQGDRTTRQRAEAISPQGYLTKPYTPTELVEAVARVLAA